VAFASTGAAFNVAGVPIAENSALVDAQTNTAKSSFSWNF
jgi:hypothetical protein